MTHEPTTEQLNNLLDRASTHRLTQVEAAAIRTGVLGLRRDALDTWRSLDAALDAIRRVRVLCLTRSDAGLPLWPHEVRAALDTPPELAELHRRITVYLAAEYCTCPDDSPRHEEVRVGEYVCLDSPLGDVCAHCTVPEGDEADSVNRRNVTWPCSGALALTPPQPVATEPARPLVQHW